MMVRGNTFAVVVTGAEGEGCKRDDGLRSFLVSDDPDAGY